MKIDLSDGIGDELNARINIKARWLIWIALAFLFIGGAGFSYYKWVKLPESTKISQQITEDFNVRRHFDGSTWGTFWDYCGVTLTADHVPAGMADNGEAFTGKTVHRSSGVIDAAWYGERWKCDEPSNPERGMDVYVLGYPGGSGDASLREGRVYLQRGSSGSPGYEIATWIVVFDGVEITAEPVVGGMSGGIVTDHEFNPVGILVTQNSPSDLDNDGKPDQSADIVGLADFYAALIE